MQLLRLFIALFLPLHLFSQTPLRRSESFFGLHFDFHAVLEDTLIGKTLTESTVDSLLTKVKPDFIQVDCKGHSGVTSYPTKVGHTPKRFEKDILRLFREVTRRHGVALYVHYSGVWDNEAIKHHPHWARIDSEGKQDKQKASLWGAYTDSLLIPQLKEISDYGVDGVWVDGDCWATNPDYGDAAVNEFRFVTGIKEIPKKKTDPNYAQWLEFQRDAFRRYVRKYTDALHAYNPRFQVASNWSFSAMMPEKVDINVDFLSGDTEPLNGANQSAFQARCLAPQGKPWDLMSWSFGYGWDDQTFSAKSTAQLSQEAAQVIAMGGGYQAYWTQLRDGSLKTYAYGTMADLAKFCRQRQPFCQKTKPVPQVALLYSNTGYKSEVTTVYNTGDRKQEPMIGVLNALLYNQLPTEILQEHHLKGKTGQYPLIVVPEWKKIDEELRNELADYVRQGGNLLVIGSETVKIFENELGVKLNPTTQSIPFWGFDNLITGTKAMYRPFEHLTDTQTFGQWYSQEDKRFAQEAIASIATLGKGKIAGIYFNFGEQHFKRETYVGRDFIGTLALRLFQPQVTVSGSKAVNVVLSQKQKNTLVHLINMAGNHANKAIHSSDEIPPLYNLRVAVKTPQRPRQIVLQPENKPLPFAYKNGESVFIISKLAIHSIVEIKP
ncbi:MAG: alpha-L-fucosidase [Spirosomataceae bacterium]